MPLDQELSRELSEETRMVQDQPAATDSNVLSDITETASTDELKMVAPKEQPLSEEPTFGEKTLLDLSPQKEVSLSPSPPMPSVPMSSSAMDTTLPPLSEALTEQMRLMEEELSALTRQQIDMQEQIASVNGDISKQVGLLTRCLNENEKFQIQVRQNMYQELEQLKKQVAGGHLIPILKAIADLYSEYRSILFQEELPKRTQNNLEAMFDQLQELLEENGAEIFQSKVGDHRATRRCRVISTIPTSDSELHNTIAVVKRCGVMLGTQVLTREWVDVYVYKEPEQDNPSPAQKEEPQELVQTNQSSNSEDTGAEEMKL